MALIFFAQSMFGNLIVIRILREFSDRALISSRFLCGIGIFFALITSAVSFFPGMTSSFLLLIVCFSIVAVRWTLKNKEDGVNSTLAGQLGPFLDAWILNLRTGMSLSFARERALLRSEPLFQSLLRPVFQGATSHRHVFLSKSILNELRLAAETPHNALERLQNLRGALTRSEIFRRKSGQALRQANLQATVLLILQFLLTGFVVHRAGWRGNLDLIVLAAGMAAAGAYSIRYLSRRIKWTI